MMFMPLTPPTLQIKPLITMGQNGTVEIRFEITDALTGAYIPDALVAFTFKEDGWFTSTFTTIQKRADSGGNVFFTDEELLESDEAYGISTLEGVYRYNVSAFGYVPFDALLWDTLEDPGVSPLFGTIVGVDMMPVVTAGGDGDGGGDTGGGSGGGQTGEQTGGGSGGDTGGGGSGGGSGTQTGRGTPSTGIPTPYIVGGISVAVILAVLAIK